MPPPPPTRFLSQSALADLADIPATSRWVRSGGTRLHVLDYGGDGVPWSCCPASPARPSRWTSWLVN